MKRIDKATERKLYWLFIPMGMVVVWIITYLWFDLNLLERCLGIQIDVLTWSNPALIGAAMIVFAGYSIAAIKQKCWGELTVGLVIFIVLLMNMSSVFIKLLFPEK